MAAAGLDYIDKTKPPSKINFSAAAKTDPSVSGSIYLSNEKISTRAGAFLLGGSASCMR